MYIRFRWMVLRIRGDGMKKTDFQAVNAFLDERLFDLKDRAMRALKHAREAAAAPTQARKHRAFAAIMDMEAGQKILALSIHEIFDRIMEEEGQASASAEGGRLWELKAEGGWLKADGKDKNSAFGDGYHYLEVSGPTIKAHGGNIQTAAIAYHVKQQKITLKALGERAKVPYSSMKKYAKGLRPIPDKVWVRIQAAIKRQK